MFLSVYLLLGAIIFGSDQEVREVMRAVRRNNATGMFSWIGSDGWSARNLVSDGNEPEVSTLFLFFKFLFLALTFSNLVEMSAMFPQFKLKKCLRISKL